MHHIMDCFGASSSQWLKANYLININLKKQLTLDDIKGDKIIEIWDNEDYSIFFNDFEEVDSDFNLVVNVTWIHAHLYIKWRVFSGKTNKKTIKIKINILWEDQKIKLDLKWITVWKSLIEFDWIWIIWKGSKRANLEIKERILLFSKDSIWKALPVLRVESNDIWNVSHSAVITPIDEDELFYLSTRGIWKQEAIDLIKEGFLK